MMNEFAPMSTLTDQQRTIFMSHMSAARKSDITAILLAFFLGSFGAHKFYMGETGWGILYLCFCWTFIPHIISFVECFLLPGRVRRYNTELAYRIAEQIRTGYAAPANYTPTYPV